ncbi:MAG: hypothetical protein PHS92_00060 [Candidatus Gracilibacteria bacterium]|nr:hypothetical protein [Candidatus Gracilibacteria bacterium]
MNEFLDFLMPIVNSNANAVSGAISALFAISVISIIEGRPVTAISGSNKKTIKEISGNTIDDERNRKINQVASQVQKIIVKPREKIKEEPKVFKGGMTPEQLESMYADRKKK